MSPDLERIIPPSKYFLLKGGGFKKMIPEDTRLEILQSNKKNYPHITSKVKGLQNNLDDIEKGLIQNKAQYLLIKFFLKLHQTMEKIAIDDNDEATEEFLHGLNTYIRQDYEYWKDNLKITTLNDLDELVHIMKLSKILINEAQYTRDTEQLWEAYYQVKYRLEKEQLTTVQEKVADAP